jgi:hypothetical protein
MKLGRSNRFVTFDVQENLRLRSSEMGVEAGACAVYGILMCEVTHRQTVEVYEEFLQKAAAADGDHPFDDISIQDWYGELSQRLVQAFALDEVIVPEGVSLLYTGSEDDRPGRCLTPADE